MAPDRLRIEYKLASLKEQRDRYVLAARAADDRAVALRHLTRAERAAVLIAELEDILESQDQVTQPISLVLETTLS